MTKTHAQPQIKQLIRSHRKTIALIIEPDATLKIKAPYFASKRDIDLFLTRKSAWVAKKQREVAQKIKALRALNLKRLFPVGHELTEINKHAHFLAEAHGLKFKKLTLTRARTRWGSCSRNGQIRINIKLVWAPLAVLNYVIAHELAHLKFMDHSTKFWSFVEHLCPGYRIHRKWLRDYGPGLHLQN